MALIMSHTLEETGVSGDYWKIKDLRIDDVNERAVVTIVLFISQSHRDNGKNSIEERSYVWKGADFPFDDSTLENENPYGTCYTKMKTDDPFWENAIDG